MFFNLHFPFPDSKITKKKKQCFFKGRQREPKRIIEANLKPFEK